MAVVHSLGADLARAVFAWMDLSGLSLKGRNLADADFAAACLEGCDLTGAKLDNANFFGADMQDAILAEARQVHPGEDRAGAAGSGLEQPVVPGADDVQLRLRQALSHEGFSGEGHQGTLRALT
ncbi:pentapeptide repeat-containing protein [Methylobacterium organophilum]|nr:pentapeptide repeat-containing protein [Methylobacterium organophilum]